MVSIVTVTLNAARHLDHTIRSVIAQRYPAIEYVIVDGGSTDGSLDVIGRHQSGISKWISEPDRGIADAFNKGVKLATGRYITFVNAGDWIEPDHIATAVECLKADPNAVFVYGDLVHWQSGKPLYMTKGSSDYRRRFGYRMGALNHPTIVCRRDLFEIVGLFDPCYRVAMDFNWLQRLHQASYGGIYCERICGNMETGGQSERQGLLANRENRISSIRLGRNKLMCWALYLGYAARFRVRTLIGRLLPERWVLRLRQTMLGSLRIVDGDRG